MEYAGVSDNLDNLKYILNSPGVTSEDISGAIYRISQIKSAHEQEFDLNEPVLNMLVSHPKFDIIDLLDSEYQHAENFRYPDLYFSRWLDILGPLISQELRDKYKF